MPVGIHTERKRRSGEILCWGWCQTAVGHVEEIGDLPTSSRLS